MSESALAVCLAPTLYSRYFKNTLSFQFSRLTLCMKKSDVLDNLDAMGAAKMSQQMHRTVSDIVARRAELFPDSYISTSSISSSTPGSSMASPRASDQSISMNVVGTIPVAASPPFNVIIIQCKSEVIS